MIYLKTPTKDLSVYELRKIVCETIMWCESNIGKKKRTKKLSFHVHTQKGSPLSMFGQYVEEDKKIYIYRNNCETVKDVVRTTLHEYCHHMQNLKLYYVTLLVVGYRNHPQEVEARSAEKLYSSCWNRIKHNI